MNPSLTHDQLRSAAESWLASDPDRETRDQLAALLAAGSAAEAELRACFEPPLQFGTAGLRGILGPGPARFNVALVCRTALAICRWLDENDIDPSRPVLLGFDARHKSALAAHHAARVVLASRRRAVVMPFPAPTPFTAFTARKLNAAAALMVTASHNPATDNGVKVFGPDHRQIVPPTDKEIAALLAAVDHIPTTDLEPELVGLSVWHEYVARCASLAVSSPSSRPMVNVAYTAMHGVGAETLAAVFSACGFGLHSVAAQNDPDPDFPTTSFPNPEEPGAMDMVLDLASRVGASLAIANDPDADRLACAVRLPDGTFRVLTGDELGCVLLWHLVEHRSLAGMVATTLVSSDLSSKICAARGLPHTVTPTGFKWLSRLPDLKYAYEEAIGFCVDPDHVSDKDGISAAVLLADMIASGVEPAEVLAELDRRFGAHVQENFSLRLDPTLAARLQAALLDDTPRSLGGFDVLAVENLADHPTRPGPGVRMYLSGQGTEIRMILRPSGTEPKSKVYVESVHQDRGIARKHAADLRAALHGLLDSLG